MNIEDLSKEKIEEIINDYKKGLPVKEIVKKHNIYLALLYEILRKYNIPLRKTEKQKMPTHKRKKKSIIKKIVKMYRRGTSIYKISKQLGLPTSTVYYILKRQGLKK
ncbi:conserved hypothetical protein [Staphylothermus marinus F1]|uniref:Resolvase helix-turn-helix domain protein n=1 Tax=Staphylothermus marinus (strain ATCC 43588 / DSM 3639 / JCM 9404 / F1) TaxID=399550 RepID=A3DN45_STAMF|nr:helix-turn-helix domain-containing protein [Staphylothermus marinus]ABN70055.1 conserved hypothetical protein [Staphylothermus marinus F1]